MLFKLSMGDQKHTTVTSALPYVNNIPHLGNVVGCVLSADVYARYLRSLPNNKVTYIGGVDEYGTATEMKARELGISCKELCDRNYVLHKQVYDWFRIKFDAYGRTSQPNGRPEEPDLTWNHTRITCDIYRALVELDYIVELEETVWYCDEIKSFVADRYIISTCYFCQSEKADGDQCDSCGRLLSTDKLQDARYKPNPEFALRKMRTKNLYLDLPKIWKECDLDTWYAQNVKSWTPSAKAITDVWLKNGLQERSITRDLKWGTRVPDTAKFGDAYKDKVFYVWFDAPIGYLSILQSASWAHYSDHLWDQVDHWCQTDEQSGHHTTKTDLVQFMAKDNVPFHSIIFPCTLAPIHRSNLASRSNDSLYRVTRSSSKYQLLPNVTIVSTDYLMCEGTKFSKSKNTGLFCDDVMRLSDEHNLDPDLWRAYLIFIRPETGDSNFVLNENGFVDFVNNILIHNLGNMTNRILNILFQYSKKHGAIMDEKFQIVDPSDPDYSDNPDDQDKIDHIVSFEANVCDIGNIHHQLMSDKKLRDAFKALLDISAECNSLINRIEPWTYSKMEKQDIPNVFYFFMCQIHQTIRALGHLLIPFMPNIGEQIVNDYKIVKYPHTGKSYLDSPRSKPVPMFKPLEYFKVVDVDSRGGEANKESKGSKDNGKDEDN